MTRTNEYGQTIGSPVPDWTPRQRPPATPMQGRYTRVEPLDPRRHGADLYAAYSRADGELWTYLSTGPFPDAASFNDFLSKAAASADPMHHAIIDVASGKAIGMAALMRIDPVNGVIEVGHVCYSPLLQRTAHATEVQYLLMKRVFEQLGYRRFEWKCDSLNAPSRKAAIRYGFTFEGIFRQAIVYKGRTRDTAWFSVIDSEWPALRAGYEVWLAPDNFDADGRQRRSLATCIGRAREGRVNGSADGIDNDSADASRLIARLGLQPHPEGGYYRETYRSTEILHRPALGVERTASTAIYYLLCGDAYSAWHRIRSDEIWHFHAGGPLHVHVLDGQGGLTTHRLGNAIEDSQAMFQAVVPAGCWFAAERVSQAGYTLVGCTVAPGFEFSDFELADAARLAADYPAHGDLIAKLASRSH